MVPVPTRVAAKQDPATTSPPSRANRTRSMKSPCWRGHRRTPGKSPDHRLAQTTASHRTQSRNWNRQRHRSASGNLPRSNIAAKMIPSPNNHVNATRSQFRIDVLATRWGDGAEQPDRRAPPVRSQVARPSGFAQTPFEREIDPTPVSGNSVTPPGSGSACPTSPRTSVHSIA